MTLQDCCRFCQENLRIKGTLTGTKKVFESDKAHNEKTVAERLQELGLSLRRDDSRSGRVCRTCLRLIDRLERDLPAFRRWQEEEREKSAEAATSSDDVQEPCQTFEATRDREPTPSKTPRAIKKQRPAPQTPTKTPTRNLPKPADKMPARRSHMEVS